MFKTRRGFRQGIYVVAAAMLLTSFISATAEIYNLKFNYTSSAPYGIYQAKPYVIGESLEKGRYILFCADEQLPIIATAIERTYISPGSCPNRSAPLLKPIAALPGNVIELTRPGVIVDGQPIDNTPILTHDRLGRPLNPIALKRYTVPANKVWVIANHLPESFDSRYFGPVPLERVTHVAQPLWISQ